MVSDTEEEDDKEKEGEKTKKKVSTSYILPSLSKLNPNQKKHAAVECYDTSDPFIDDSELAMDERRFFGQTKQTGFYVSSGEVALLKDKTPKKPKSSKNPLHTVISSVAGKGAKDKDKDKDKHRDKDKDKDRDRADGTREFPVTIPSRSSSDAEPDDLIPEARLHHAHGQDPKTGEKRKRYVTIVEGGKKRKMVDLVRPLPFPLCPPSDIFLFPQGFI